MKRRMVSERDCLALTNGCGEVADALEALWHCAVSANSEPAYDAALSTADSSSSRVDYAACLAALGDS